ncbi:ATP-binding protein [Luedemannella helvata]|uniref:Tetratricopeptide repeat protein n=1 Tax=Luedemannella helvata TaxID=349315 RepID=A0ABP4WW33_9ACTN
MGDGRRGDGMARQGAFEERSGHGFGPLLLALRQSAGLTQEDLAASAGLSVRAVRDMERGRVRQPRQSTVSALATALNLAAGEEAELAAAAGTPRPTPGAPARPAPEAAGDAHAWPVPRELPAACGDLVGREDELAMLADLAHDVARGRRQAPGIVAVHGPPGVGKTTLAVAAGHRLGAAFPDGQLFLDLGNTGERPMPVAEALAVLLRSLGVPDSVLPRPAASLAGLYRTLTRDRRLLLVLDNAVDEAQVRALLPSGGGCLVIVTSRRSLTGLESAARVAVDVLAAGDAAGLLAAIVGRGRVAVEPQAVDRLARLCGQLPLALRIAGNRLASRPRWRIDELVAQLADEQRRLTALTAGDLGVEAAIAVSYRQLRPATAELLRVLSLVPGVHFGVRLAASVAGVAEHEAARAVEELVDSGLLLANGERYRLHDLIRLFALDRLRREDPPALRAAARDRMVGWVVESTVAAARQLDPEAGGTPTDADQRAALDWLDVEDSNWLATLRDAARRGRHADVVAIARAMHWYSDAATHRHPWHEVFSLGVDAARALGRRHDEAALLNFLGWALYLCQDRNEDGLAVHRRALALAREIGDRREEAWALAYSAAIGIRTGDPEGATRLARQAVRIFDEIGYAMGQHIALAILGGARAALGDFPSAMRAHLRYLAYARNPSAGLTPTGALVWQASGAMSLGADLAGLGHWRAAADRYDEAHALYRRTGTPFGQASALYRYGLAMRELGDEAAARANLRRALALFTGIGSVWWQERVRAALDHA